MTHNFKNSKTILILSSIFFSFMAQAATEKYQFVVGTYTTKTKSKGLYGVHLDMKNKVVKPNLLSSKVSDPSFLAISRDKKNLYALSEQSNSRSVNAFSFDSKSGALELLNTVNSGGADPCFVDITPTHLVVANYSGGNLAVFGRNANGTLTEQLQLITHTGSSVNAQRQTKSHVHQTIFSPDNKYLLVNNLGTDKLTCYRYNKNEKDSILTFFDEIKLKPGSGPRHLTFSKNAKFIFLLHEIDGTVSTLSLKNGKLSYLSETTIVLKNGIETGAADIHFSPDGRFVYATNRGNANDITCFAIGKNGTLKLVEQSSVYGQGPRNFCITKDGKYILVGNQYTNQVVVLKRDKKSGKLSDTDIRAEIAAPVCIVEY